MNEGTAKSHILTVSQLTAQIKHLLEGAFPDIWIEGEISNLSVPQSGHAYFTLKDEQSQIRAVLFRSSQRFLKFTLQHGMQVICRARIGVYEPRGEYQIIVDYIEPKGAGALQLAFEQLRLRLEKEGLFDLAHKKTLPVLPQRIAFITSPTGAAIRDMLRVIKRRHPNMHILVYPVPVQGTEAAPAIVEAVRYFNREQNVDVIIVGRGGGSLEDLWAFNEEAVARAIHDSAIPVISAVGHETDYTIADFAADLRAPTPSAAAEMVVESEAAFRERIASVEARLTRSMRHRLERARAALRVSGRLLGDLRRMLEQLNQRVDELTHRGSLALGHLLKHGRSRLKTAAGGLEHLNPLGVLLRGYSITKRIPAGSIIMSVAGVDSGSLISTRVSDGEILSRVEKTKKNNSS
ncbi:MAG TPA: exodeoxyribonuclease VII large subunit [Nitrospirota bacterium]|nr:exodeoxyribonuclease VII large subunit [Nitrospirota bacterium]